MSSRTLKRMMDWLRRRFRPHAVSGPTLGQMMVSEPVCVTKETSLDEAIKIIEDKGFDQLPVILDPESKQLVGALTSHQVVIWARDWEGSSALVGDAMETPWDGLDRSPQDEMSEELLDYFKIHDFVVVVDDKQHVIGIVQLWDISRELWYRRR